MFKETRLYSILNNKCPRCHEGDFFINNNPYDLKDLTKMHLHCPKCGEQYERETGFYYGAMYVSYGLNIALGVGLFILTVLLLDLSTTTFLFIFLGAVLLLFPWIFRKSRLIWINLFVHYKKPLT
ncbi:MAG: DUF983 domain-containing protein [Bacteroidetes bacterium]|nr:DUF983 domain-containing protein [Bacteroidota bacterium]